MFNWPLLISYQSQLCQGLVITLQLTGCATVLAILLGLLGALLKTMPPTLLRNAVSAFVQIFRNTPLLIQLYFAYHVLPLWHIEWSPWMCGMTVLALQNAAYMVGIFEASVFAIPHVQVDSAWALGLSPQQTFWKVLLPQSLAQAIPPLGNQVVALLKNSSLVAFIAVPDLFFTVFKAGADTFEAWTFLLTGIILYVLLVSIVTIVFRILEGLFSVRHVIQQRAAYVG